MTVIGASEQSVVEVVVLMKVIVPVGVGLPFPPLTVPVKVTDVAGFADELMVTVGRRDG